MSKHMHNWQRVGNGPWLHCAGCDKWTTLLATPTVVQGAESWVEHDKRVMREAAEDAKNGLKRVRGEAFEAPTSAPTNPKKEER